MSNSDRPPYLLTVEAPEPGLGVMLIDAAGNVVARCPDDQSQITLELPRGLYTVRSSRSGTFAEIVVRLDAPRKVRAALPQVYSAGTIPGAETTHEYYTYPAWSASQHPTAPEQAWNGVADASLLLFVRAPQRNAYKDEDQLASMSLHTLTGITLSEFKSDAKRHADGWSAYCAKLSHGLLILEDRGERPRQIPVPLIRGWQTQLYVIHHKRLLWEDMRLTTIAIDELKTRHSRDPYDPYAEDVRAALDMDAGLLALQNDTPTVAPQLVSSFLNSKFQNPILGVLGAYLLLLNHKRQSTNENFRPDPASIRIVLDNLQNLLHDSADVAALRLLAEPWLGKPTLGPITRVPLFRYGAEVLLKASVSAPSLLPEGTLLDTVSDELYGDTVWTTWKPVQHPLSMRAAPALAKKTRSDANWVSLALADALALVERRAPRATLDDLLRQIGASPHAVRDALEGLVENLAKSQPLLPEEEGLNLRFLHSKAMSNLAHRVGARLDQRLLHDLERRAAAQESTEPKPSLQKIYAGLKKTLAELASPDTGKISADTSLADIVKPDNKPGRHFAGQRLARSFRDFAINVSGEELGKAETVRDLAQLLSKKMTK